MGLAFSDLQQQVQGALRPVAAQDQAFREWQERIAAEFAPVREELERHWKQMAELAPLFKQVAEAWRRLPAGVQQAQDLAASRGWYIGASSESLSEVAELARLGEGGDAQVIENWLVRKTRTRTESIRDRLLESFPSRSTVLEQAFEAHDRSHYGVSIPAMLAQADGIHFDILDQHLFTKNNRRRLKRRLSERLESSQRFDFSSVVFVFLRPLVRHSALEENTQSRDSQPRTNESADPLNRHGVLHGIDLTYATELNGLKTVALLDFLEWVHTDLNGWAA